MSLLLDFYGSMLSDKQREVTSLYYNEDLSLSEIAEDVGITRQGVRDSIKRSENQLTEFEEKLHLAKKYGCITTAINKLNGIVSNMKKHNDNCINDEIFTENIEELEGLIKLMAENN